MATAVVVSVLGGLLSFLPQGPRLVTLVVVAVVLAVTDLATRRLPLPQRDALIPQEVFAGGMRPGLFRFGVEYGLGWRVLVPSAAPWILATGFVLLNLPWWQTLLAGAVFGAGRSVAIWQMIFFASQGWQARLLRHTRALERLGSVTVTGVVVAVAIGTGG